MMLAWESRGCWRMRTLLGGSDAKESCTAIITLIHEVLHRHGLPSECAALLTSHEDTDWLLQARGIVDLIIPRGSSRLINYVREHAQVPVIETGAGVVHCYVDRAADIEKAIAIVVNAKTRRVSVCNALDCLLVHRDRELDEETAKRYFSLIQRRSEHYPLQYLLQEWDFYNLSFTVKEGVLIPRPETELLVDFALQYLKKYHTEGPPARVLDLCSGSGCVGITVERNFPNCEVTAVEKSDQACAIIRGNMERNRTDRFTLLQGDLFDGPAAFGIDAADLILANPPYLTKEEMESLQAEVGYEPSLALYGGEDGLIFYRGIADLWSPVLEKDGLIAVEIGEQQGDSVAQIFADFSDDIKVFKDYSGLPRVVVSGPSFFLTI